MQQYIEATLSEVSPEGFEQVDSESSLNPENSHKKKALTQAQIMGKTAGRWTKEEHRKFV
jgi:hypothetical protein